MIRRIAGHLTAHLGQSILEQVGGRVQGLALGHDVDEQMTDDEAARMDLVEREAESESLEPECNCTAFGDPEFDAKYCPAHGDDVGVAVLKVGLAALGDLGKQLQRITDAEQSVFRSAGQTKQYGPRPRISTVNSQRRNCTQCESGEHATPVAHAVDDIIESVGQFGDTDLADSWRAHLSPVAKGATEPAREVEATPDKPTSRAQTSRKTSELLDMAADYIHEDLCSNSAEEHMLRVELRARAADLRHLGN